MEYKYNKRYEELCDKYCIIVDYYMQGSLESPYSTITISFSDFDSDEELAFMTAYAIDLDEVEECWSHYKRGSGTGKRQIPKQRIGDTIGFIFSLDGASSW